jgi:hypothetical protein
MKPEQMAAALDAAFAAQVGLLFKNLCTGIAEETATGKFEKPDARGRYESGFCIAVLAHDELTKKLQAEYHTSKG